MDAIQSTSAAPSSKYIAAIEAALRIIVGDDEDAVTEIRGLGCIANGYRRPHSRGGFFHSSKLHDAARAAFAMSAGMKAAGVYVMLNPVKHDALARKANRIDIVKEGGAASDSDILKRRWLLVDCDPNRIPGVSSSNEEKQAALDKAIAIRDYFAGRGWPDPILCDSGNGWHLLYRIDLPNNDESTKLVKRCLRAISAKFSDATVSIDTSVFNAARICKLYGTMTRKGDSTEDRPHRLARLVKGPTENHRPVDELYLTALATEAPEETRVSGSAAGSAGGGSATPPSGGKRKGKSIRDRAADYISKMPVSISGQHGHDKAYRVACVLVRGFALAPEAAFPIMWEAWNPHCEPPWSERELMHKLEDAAANADGEPGYLIYANRKGPGESDVDTSGVEFVLPEANESNPLAGLSLDLDGDCRATETDCRATETDCRATIAPSGEALPQSNSIASVSAGRPHDISDPVYLAQLLGERKFRHPDGWTLRWHSGDWLLFDSGKYSPVGQAELDAMILAFCDEVFLADYMAKVEAARKNPDQPVPTKKNVSRDIVANVREALRAMVMLRSTIIRGTWIGGPHFGRDHRDFISVSNGIVDQRPLFNEDVSDEVLLPHSPLFFSTSCVPYPYDPEATCPTWLKFLETNFQGDDEQIRLFQEWCGYCVTRDTSQQKFVVMDGPGGNGKSVACAGLTAILGTDNVSNIPLESFEKETALSQTIGKLANIAAEIGEIDKVAEGVLKSFTSGDRMTFRRLYKDPYEAFPTARLIFATNNRPRFSDRSDGLWRRMLLLTLTYRVPDDERVYGMDRPDFWAAEASGMLNWALAGLWELKQYGRFTIPEKMKESLAAYQRETNPAKEFLEDRCQLAPSHVVSKSDLYAAYHSWAISGGYKPLAKGSFGREVHKVFPDVADGKITLEFTTGKRQVHAYHNLRLLPAENENEFV